MSIITSEARFRQRVLRYSMKYGVTKASNRFGRSRQAIYEWRAKWDGKSWRSLMEKSHRPHHHPAEHTAEEKKMILHRYPRYKGDMMMLWDSLRKSGYTRSYTSLVRSCISGCSLNYKDEQHIKASHIQEQTTPGKRCRWTLNLCRHIVLSMGRNIINIPPWMNVRAGHTESCMTSTVHTVRRNSLQTS